MRKTLALLLLLLLPLAGACARPATGVELRVQLQGSFAANELQVTAGYGPNEPAFAPARLPETRRPLDTQESFFIVLPDDAAGRRLDVHVIALAAAAPVAEARGSLELVHWQTPALELVLTEGVDCDRAPPGTCREP